MPDVARLESIDSVAEMNQLDYAESWAWVHFLLSTDQAHLDVLQRYLQSTQATNTAGPLSPALGELHVEPNRTLAEYISSLE